jgi:peptide/nickel transport system substrate-binding protein
MDLATLIRTPGRTPSSQGSPMHRRHSLRSVLPVGLALLVGCGTRGTDAAPSGGTVIITTSADAEAMVPQTRTTVVGRLASELLFDPLVELGPTLDPIGDAGFVPRLARRWSWSADSLALSFELDPRARWHDGRPVVARDVVSGFVAIRDPENASTFFADVAEVDSVVARDEHTAVVYFATRTPEQMSAASLIFPLPSHLVDTIPSGSFKTSAFSQTPVGSGPYRFVSREPKVRLELAAVEDHYRGRPGPDRIALTVSQNPAAAIAKLWTEEADVWDVLPAADVEEAKRHPHIRLVPSAGFDYVFVGFNFRDPADTARAHPLLAEPAMRRALTMGVDRASLVRAMFDTLAYVSLGPFVRAQVTADTTLPQIPFDPTAAGALLDSLGWRTTGADGIRRRAGRSLVLRALVPAPSANRVRASVLVQEQLRRVGVDLVLETLEGSAFGAALVGGRFDLYFGGWSTTPSPRGIRGTWGSRTRPGWGAQNYGRYADPGFDSEIAAGLGSLDPGVYRQHFRTAYRTIVGDAAAIWLYEPLGVNAVHRRFVLPPWRADAWWRTLPAWRLDPAVPRLPRDARPNAP